MISKATRAAGLLSAALLAAPAYAQETSEPTPAAPVQDAALPPAETPPPPEMPAPAATPETPAPAATPETPAPAATPEAAPAAAAAAPAASAAPVKGPDEWWVPSLFGDPLPYSRRPPTNRMFTLEVDLKYALVGTGPTRFVNDIRFSALDWVEFRTQLGPVIIPETLMARFSVGNWQKMGRLGFETGIHKFDIGARLFPESGESRGLNPGIIPSANLVGNFTYDLPIWDRFAVHLSARFQQRVQQSVKKALAREFTNPLDQLSFQLAAQGTWDITRQLGLTVGTAYGTAIDNKVLGEVFDRARGGTAPWDDPALPTLSVNKMVDRRDPFTFLDTRGQCGENKTRTIFIDFAESARPGYATLVDRDNNCSLSINGSLTYGRTESFDVDLFGAARVWPQIGGLFGAGIRWRIAP
jgi:hypothetical protein